MLYVDRVELKTIKGHDEMKHRDEKGFSLIELLIVVAIIGILAAIAIPQFNNYRKKVFNATAQSDLANAKVAIEAFYTDNTFYPNL